MLEPRDTYGQAQVSSRGHLGYSGARGKRRGFSPSAAALMASSALLAISRSPYPFFLNTFLFDLFSKNEPAQLVYFPSENRAKIGTKRQTAPFGTLPAHRNRRIRTKIGLSLEDRSNFRGSWAFSGCLCEG